MNEDDARFDKVLKQEEYLFDNDCNFNLRKDEESDNSEETKQKFECSQCGSEYRTHKEAMVCEDECHEHSYKNVLRLEIANRLLANVHGCIGQDKVENACVFALQTADLLMEKHERTKKRRETRKL